VATLSILLPFMDKRATLTFLLKQIEGFHERTEHLDIFFRPSLNGVLFTGGRGVSDFSILKYY